MTLILYIYRAQSLPSLHSEDTVWLPDEGIEASVQGKMEPRSYNVATPNGVTLKQNRSHLRLMPHQHDRSQTDNNAQVALVANRTETHLNGENNEIPPNSDGPVFSTESYKRVVETSSGRISRPPKRFGKEP